MLNRELDTALDQCRHALRVRPKSANAWDSLGFTEFRRRALGEAVASFDQAPSLEPDAPGRCSCAGS